LAVSSVTYRGDAVLVQLEKVDRVVVEYEAEGSGFKFAKTARAYFSKRNVLLVQIWVNDESCKSLDGNLIAGVPR